MAYNTNPTAEYVQKLAKRMEIQWAPQKLEDEDAFALYRRKERMDTAEPSHQAGKVQLKPLRTGRPGISVDRDAARLAVPPGWRVNPISKDRKNSQHASNLLEPWLSADFQLSAVGEVYYPQCRDLRLFGRGWSNKYPLPRMWATDEYRKLVDIYKNLVDQGTDEKAIRDARADLEDYKRRHYPLRWRWMDARGVWPQWSEEVYLPEVVEIRRMKLGQVRADYGDDVVPGPRQKDGDTADIDVYVYHNHIWTMTVIGNNEDPQGTYKWDHDLGMNPCILMETNIQQDEGIRWKSSLYDHKDMLETENEILSDIRHNSRRNTLAGPMFSLNLEEREQDTKAAQKGDPIDFEPGKPIFLRLDEKAEQAPSPIVNPQSIQLLEFTADYNSQILFNPIEMGRLPSGTAAVGLTTAFQIGQVRLDPYSMAIKRGLKQYGILTFRCVERLNREFPDAPDKVTAVDEVRGELAVGSQDVKRWENQIQPRLDIALPVNRNSEMALAQGASSLTIPPDVILEQYLKFENSEDVIDRWIEWKVLEALLGNLVQQTQVRAGAIAQEVPAADLQALAERIANLPPASQAALGLVGAPGAPQIPGGIAQGAANQRRATVPQQLSETGAQEVGAGGRL